MAQSRPRTIVYVDGFNLYYGAVKGTAHKWLNLEKFFALLRPHDDLQVIRYFTALISGPHLANQQAYLNALVVACPRVGVVLGTFKQKRIKCAYTQCAATTPGDRVFSTQEEKRTDVNIAVFMLDDAYQARCDQQVVVTGDSDLVPACTGPHLTR